MLFDMHCHLGFVGNAYELASQAAERDIHALSVSVSPREFEHTSALLAPFENVNVALGLHPWQVADGGSGTTLEQAIRAFERLAPDISYIGEVGLDYGKKYVCSRDAQRTTFAGIARACATHPNGSRLISLHAVKAEDELLDILEESGCIDSAHCILHSFSGSLDQLYRAIGDGCWFSVGERMLRTGRGREYVKVIPQDRLLLESDAPSSSVIAFSIDEYEEILNRTQSMLEELCGIRLHDILVCNAQELLDSVEG